jgi:hypothetical protein
LICLFRVYEIGVFPVQAFVARHAGTGLSRTPAPRFPALVRNIGTCSFSPSPRSLTPAGTPTAAPGSGRPRGRDPLGVPPARRSPGAVSAPFYFPRADHADPEHTPAYTLESLASSHFFSLGKQEVQGRTFPRRMAA